MAKPKAKRRLKRATTQERKQFRADFPTDWFVKLDALVKLDGARSRTAWVDRIVRDEYAARGDE